MGISQPRWWWFVACVAFTGSKQSRERKEIMDEKD